MAKVLPCPRRSTIHADPDPAVATNARLRYCLTYCCGAGEPDVRVESRQPARQRLTRPANLLQARRHLVIAQARVVTASRADDLIPVRVALISMAVDHADGLRPEKSGTVVVPGDCITDRHAAIVRREPNARSRGE